MKTLIQLGKELKEAGKKFNRIAHGDFSVLSNEIEVCPNCGEELEIRLENNGFNYPNPVYYEDYLICNACGWREI